MKKWRLLIGCHRGTLTSRDATTEEHDTLEDCRKAVRSFELSWASIGYYVWFAKAIGPNDEEEILHPGTSYH